MNILLVIKNQFVKKKEELISSISKNAVFNVEPEDYTIEIVAEYNTKEDWGWIFSLREDSNGKGLQFINYYNTDPTDHVTEISMALDTMNLMERGSMLKEQIMKIQQEQNLIEL